jgi:hypothetical protein
LWRARSHLLRFSSAASLTSMAQSSEAFSLLAIATRAAQLAHGAAATVFLIPGRMSQYPGQRRVQIMLRFGQTSPGPALSLSTTSAAGAWRPV